MQEIDIGQLEKTLRSTLAEIEEDAEDLLEDVREDASRRVLRKLQTGKKHGGKTPEDTGEYAAGWEETRELRGVERVSVIRNTEKPQLTHLLEYGREGMPAKQHIRVALVETLEEVNKELK